MLAGEQNEEEQGQQGEKRKIDGTAARGRGRGRGKGKGAGRGTPRNQTKAVKGAARGKAQAALRAKEILAKLRNFGGGGDGGSSGASAGAAGSESAAVASG